MRVFDVTATKQAFISEEVVAGLAWNGDAFIAMQEHHDLEFIVHEEGMLIWLDNFAIPAGAAVSYTHLAVYKRQGLWCLRAKPACTTWMARKWG